MVIPYLIKEDGAAFDDKDIEELRRTLDALSVDDRKAFRDGNAEAVATHPADQLLIIAGPGTGKSALFKTRVLFWLKRDPQARILALSFVRKLVADLSADIQKDASLTPEQKRQVEVHTLHKYARSIVEQNHGTREWQFTPHFRIIGQSWKDIVWSDVLLICGYQREHDKYSWRAFEKQVHENSFDESGEWKTLKGAYFTLCKFYNATGFADLILRARDALVENPGLNVHHHFIIDEFQDFNASEESLLSQITAARTGTLIVGDDDQVLYENLKSGRAELIRAIYGDRNFVNAMLPFCGRCDFHITRAASHFINQNPDQQSIKKVYLPMSAAEASIRVQVVGCATPTTAVDYIRKFIEGHAAEIEKRKKDLAEGTDKDPYLLILSPSNEMSFYKPGKAREQLLELVNPYRVEQKVFSDDYFMVLNYYSLAKYPANNFTLRKVLHFEGIKEGELLELLKTCLEKNRNLVDEKLPSVRTALDKAQAVKNIIEAKKSAADKVNALRGLLALADPARLRRDLEKASIDIEKVEAVEHQEEEEAELEELEIKQMAAVELMTIVGAKGLSADHVIIIGFDNVNTGWVTRNAFYVAITRARRSLHLITALKSGGAIRPHDYLNDLPDDHLEYLSYKKSEGEIAALGSRAEFARYFERLKYGMQKGRRR